MKNHNNISDKKVRIQNKKYTDIFINKFIQKTGDLNIYKEFINKDLNVNTLEDANPFQTVWLKNIDRLINLIPKNIELSQYHLIDVGCGIGFSTFYFKENFDLSSYSGFDYVSEYIQFSKKLMKLYYDESPIEFFKADASKYKLELNKSYILFIFNSFGEKTLLKFISNNILSLKKNKSIILYCNDHHYQSILGYKSYKRDEYFNLSSFIF